MLFRSCCKCYNLGIIKYSTRVRFAPSPTGLLHVGGVKTALINFLFAKSTNGKLILRIEDTDRNRLVPESVEHIVKCLSWVGITFDEGLEDGKVKPDYFQSSRLIHYREQATRLMSKGTAYPCFCSKDRIEFVRAEQNRRREEPRYNGRCRQLTADVVSQKLAAGEQHSVRLKANEAEIHFADQIFGIISSPASRNDPIILKSDGFPVYHFANVVDDHDMGITHVIRGQEWLVSTPLHLQIYSALGWQPPLFAHLPLIVKKDGYKVSKRDPDFGESLYNVDCLQKCGYPPSAVRTWLMSTGGGIDCDWQPSFQDGDLVRHFDLTKITTHNARLSESHLSLTSRHFWTHLDLTEEFFNENIHPFLVQNGESVVYHQFHRAFKAIGHRITSLQDLLEFSFLWRAPLVSVEAVLMGTAATRVPPPQTAAVTQLMANLLHLLHTDPDVAPIKLHVAYKPLMTKSQAFFCIRKILTNHNEGLRISGIFMLLDREEIRRRLEQFQAQLDERILEKESLPQR